MEAWVTWLWSLTEAGFLAAAATFVTAAITSTGRPGATVFLLLAVPTALMHSGVWDAASWFFPPAHIGLLIALGVWAVAEHFLRGELYGEIIEILPLDRLGALLFLWLAFIGKLAWGFEGSPEDLSSEFTRTIPIGPGLALLALTLPLQMVVAWARNRVFEVVRDLGFGGTLSILEILGVAGTVVGVILVPTAALAVSVAVVIPLVGITMVVRFIDVRVDRSLRRPCSGCGFAARVEASRCPQCFRDLPIERSLG